MTSYAEKFDYDAVASKVVGHGIDEANYVHADLARLGVYGDALLGVHVHMDHRKSDPLEFASGQAVALAPYALVNHEFLHANMNGQIVGAIITRAHDPREALSDEFFCARLSALATAVPAEHELSARESIIDMRTGKDKAPWKPVLGRGSFVGVYRTETAPNVYMFFLIARIDETPCGYDAYRHAERCADAKMSLQDYVDNTRTRQLLRLSRRNAERVLAEVALALGVRITCMRDISASYPELSMQKPLKAIPKMHCEFNVVRPVEYAEQNSIVLYNGCIDAYGAKNGLMFTQNPLIGITLVQGVRSNVQQFSNTAGNSFPMRVARGRDPVAARLGDGAGRLSYDKERCGAPHPEMAADAARAITRDDYAILEALSGETNDASSLPEQRLKLTPVIVHLSPQRGA